MKITICSDLHLEFGMMEQISNTEDAKVLVLAGDIFEYRRINKEVIDFFGKTCSNFEHVLYVYGNHEYYNSDINEVDSLIRKKLARFENLHILGGEARQIDGIWFYGDVLWTDMNNHNPTTMFECQQNIGDYFVIWNHGRRLEPKDTITLHLRSLTNLEEFLAEHKNEKVVVITHHGPSYLATPERFKRYRDTNGAFYSDLSELILDNPHILYWIHGHTHDPFEFDIGETKVLGNPRGYHKSESSAMNFAPRTIEIT